MLGKAACSARRGSEIQGETKEAYRTVLPSTYITAARRLVHYPNSSYWTNASVMNAFCDEAIKWRDRVTAAVRTLTSFTLTAGTDTYTFATLSPSTNIFDIVNINLIYNGTRIVLDQMPFTRLNATIRIWSPSFRDRVYAWARYGSNQVVFGPAPSLAYSVELDTCTFHSDIAAADTDDGVPYPYTESVPYYIAYLAKLNERQYDEADSFLDMAQERAVNVTSARVGMVPTQYGMR